MASKLRTWARYASWLLPHGVHVVRERWRSRQTQTPDMLSAGLLSANAKLHARHAGERCFVLGNGPSAKEIDLSRLAGEKIFSVSNGYLHVGYDIAAPQYHCVPQITYGRMKEADVVSWFIEMHDRLGKAELFLNETEADLVGRHRLFKGRVVHYVALREQFDPSGPCDAVPDISRPIPRVESVPIMALMIAMYLGFNEIVILGVDHDSWRTGSYTYAFSPQVVAGIDPSVTPEGRVLTPHYDTFHSMARLWQQYRCLRRIAEANGITIINGNAQGELDEFKRLPVESFYR